jgi:signal transduction histidine kinase
VCEAVADETRAAHPGRTVRFLRDGDLRGQWDVDRLRQVVANLVGNAIQHGTGPVDLAARAERGEGGEAGERAEEGEGGYVVLSVHNGGAPIPPEALPTLFEPLVRGREEGASRRHGSIGLGLYIAREVVTAHGGTIDVTSSAGQGTTFTVRLPRHRAAADDRRPA